MGQAGEELPSQLAEAVSACEPSHRALNVFRSSTEQGCQTRPNDGRQALDRGHLGHLAQVSPPAMLLSVAIDSAGEGPEHLYEAGLICHRKPEAAKVRGECWTARSKRDLGQKPEGVKEGRVGRGALKTSLSSVGRSCRYDVDVGAEA